MSFRGASTERPNSSPCVPHFPDTFVSAAALPLDHAAPQLPPAIPPPCQRSILGGKYPQGGAIAAQGPRGLDCARKWARREELA
eukprot:3410700-Pyramimonas_sp.AAC.1